MAEDEEESGTHRTRTAVIVSLIVGGVTTVVLAIINILKGNASNSGGTLGTSEARTVAIITGFAGIVLAVGGVFLAIRQVRSREREAARKDLARVEGYLEEERDARITAERNLYKSVLLLAQNGIEPPEGVTMRRRTVEKLEPDEEEKE